ncbi:MAG: hemerythrin domain-containing protein [Candidatus Brocadiales bacterium]
MESPTKILSEEHQRILKVIGALLNECDELESGKKLDKDFFEKAVDFIRNYADRFHHAKEEEILFVELCKDTVKMHCNPVDQMLHEHDLGRKAVKGIVEGLKDNDKEKIMDNARDYARLLQDHIFKEDNILYMMADEVLSDNVKKSMLKRFKQAEQEKFAKGAEKKYLCIAAEFEKR